MGEKHPDRNHRDGDPRRGGDRVAGPLGGLTGVDKGSGIGGGDHETAPYSGRLRGNPRPRRK